LASWHRRVYIATFGEPPLPTATSAFITALRGAITHDDRSVGPRDGRGVSAGSVSSAVPR
jgi:hypothetical protein